MIVEVVVTHEIEDATRLRYEQSGLPVFVVHPQWDTITELAHTLIADDALFRAAQAPSLRRKRN